MMTDKERKKATKSYIFMETTTIPWYNIAIKYKSARRYLHAKIIGKSIRTKR